MWAKYSKHNTFPKQHEIAFAQYLVNMHKKGGITLHNIFSHLVLQIVRSLNDFYDISYSCKTIRIKYYVLQKLAKLYISFKRKSTSMGWYPNNYIFVMDDTH